MKLTAKQISFFKENGYLILEDIIDDNTTHQWKTDFEHYFGVDITQQNAYPLKEKGNGNSASGFKFSKPSIAINQQLKIKSILNQLGGDSLQGGEAQLIIHKPAKDKKKWVKPSLAHIDLTPKHFNWRFMLGFTTYGCNVKRNGGCFIFWPKSHLKIWNFIKGNPNYFYDDYEGSADVLQKTYQDIVGGEPQQFVAKKGTVMLWHSFLLHNGSMNTTATPRLGIFGRWGQTVSSGEKRENFNDIWANWSI